MHAVPRYALCLGGLASIVAVDHFVVRINATTAALAMLLLVLAAATKWGLAESIFTSMVGVLSFNFWFLPPVGTFTIAEPQNWVALSVFLATAVTVSKLSSDAKQKAEEALAGRNEIARLYELSRSLLMDEGSDAVRHSVMRAGQILQVGAIAFYDAAANQVYGSMEDSHVTQAEMVRVAETGEPLAGRDAMVIPVHLGAHVVGSLATARDRLSSTIRESVASLLAINYERAHALQRAAAAEVARRNEEFKSSLLDGLAHDLKTPLTAIRTCVTRLIDIPPRTEEVRQELLSIIDQESLRLQHTITDAIELARIESRELHLEPRTLEMSDILEAALAEVRDENRQRYSVSMEAGLQVWADANLIRRVFLQIVENARKYAPPDSPIHIRAHLSAGHADEGHVEFAVLDRGPGFDPEEIERIFEKFFRGRRLRDRAEGTGMGLAIAKGIIEAHGGTIRAENRAGGGAAILFTLPAGRQR